jgi:hypothetical protein
LVLVVQVCVQQLKLDHMPRLLLSPSSSLLVHTLVLLKVVWLLL